MKVTKEEAYLSTKRAIDLIDQRLPTSPSYGVYIHAKDQLSEMLVILEQSNITNSEDRLFVDIGLMAAKELEAPDPELANALMDADYNFKHYGIDTD